VQNCRIFNHDNRESNWYHSFSRDFNFMCVFCLLVFFSTAWNQRFNEEFVKSMLVFRLEE